MCLFLSRPQIKSQSAEWMLVSLTPLLGEEKFPFFPLLDVLAGN